MSDTVPAQPLCFSGDFSEPRDRKEKAERGKQSCPDFGRGNIPYLPEVLIFHNGLKPRRFRLEAARGTLFGGLRIPP